MFGKMSQWVAKAKKPETSNERVRPQNTSEEALEMLREKVVEVLGKNENAGYNLKEEEIDIVADYMAIAQERTGTPYTKETLEGAFAEGLEEEILASIENRQINRGPEAPRVAADPHGEVHPVDGPADTMRRDAENREAMH